jgi:hypothetical protein
VNFAMDSASPSTDVYVKIAAPPGAFQPASPSATSTSDGFVLQVTRAPEPSLPSSLSLLQGLTPPAHLGGLSLSPLTVVSQSGLDAGARPVMGAVEETQAELVLGGASMPIVSSTADDGQPLAPSAVATGPLPVRAGAPLGGVLADGDPVPQLDRHDPALVDLALIGLPEPAAIGGAGEADLEAIVAEHGRRPEQAEGPLALRGLGGLPLVTVAFRGEPRVDPETLLASLPPVHASPTVVVQARAAIAAETDTDTVRETLPPPRRVARGSVLSGLTAAMAMVFGLVLPDMTRLMAAPAAPRFRLRFWLRRLRSGA